MALFKISKGLKANLPTSKTEGYCYFTTDDGKFYVDVTNSTRTALNAELADKLRTARSFTLSNAVSATAQNFDGSSNVTIPINGVKESFLTWGGQSISGGISPIGAALSSEHSANRFAFLNANALTFEYSNDAGSNWTNWNWSNDSKVKHVTTSETLYIGEASTVTTNHRSRMTLSARVGANSYIYTRPKKLLINMSTNGHAVQMTLEYKTGASDAAWQTLGTYNLTGWSGWNEIDVSSLTTLGGGSTQTSNIWYWRLTYKVTTVSSSYKTSRPYILSLRLFGDTCWTRTSNMGETGHLYSYDAQQNATFPAALSATNLTASGPVTGSSLIGQDITAGQGRIDTLEAQDFGAMNVNATYLSSYDNSFIEVLCNLECDEDIDCYGNIRCQGNITGSKVYGAVWNDYAEYRNQLEDIKPGYCVVSHNDGKVSKTTMKLQACDGIVSDTFGFAIGKTENCKTPLAVAGRVLAYCEGDRTEYNAGDTVCAGPNGKVCKMTREEIREWPDRIIGVVSEIPTYETWGTAQVQVNNRIWIKVK